jgi:hypothetical protein
VDSPSRIVLLASNMRACARRCFPSVERRLAAGSSRRPSTLRHRGRSRQAHRIPGEEMPCRRLAPRFGWYACGNTKSCRDPKRDQEKMSVQSPNKEPAKAPWRKAVVTGFASTDARKRDSLPRAAPTASRRKRRSDAGKCPTEHTHRTGVGMETSAGHVSERELERTWRRIHFIGEDAVTRESARRVAGSE